MIPSLPMSPATSMSPAVVDVAESVRRQLVLLSDWPPALRWGVLGLGVVILGMTIWNVRRARPWWRRALLVTLRLVLLLLLGALFLEPSIQEERVARHRNHVLVLVDDSKSMTVAHGVERRIDLAREFVAGRAPFWEALSEGGEPDFFRFSSELEPFEREDAAAALTAAGPRTDLIGALKALRERFRDRPIGGVLVLSDGIDNGRAGRAGGAQGGERAAGLLWSERAALDTEAERIVRSFDAPFFTYGVKGTAALRNLSLDALRVADFAFLLNSTALEVEVGATGYDGAEVRVTLTVDGEVAAHRTVAIPTADTPGHRQLTVPFAWVPRTLGEHVVSVRVEALAGEVTTQDNARARVVRVLRDRVRVLQIAGHPSWDVRFLRNLLKRNPNIDLISFFILVNPTNLLGVRSGETSLIPFPARELFVEELGGFDLVVFQDFNYGPFSTRQHLHRVRDWVREGGALLMIGGRLAFSAGGYDGTAVTEVLPVRLPPGGVPENTLSEERFRPALTDAGRRHPILQLGEDREDTAAIWEGLPPLEGANLFDGATEGGLVLARHPDLRHGGKGRPVMAVGEAGAGRTMVLASDSSWFWSYPNGGRGGDPHAYDRFWNNAIRWLIRDPALDLLRVEATAEVFARGDEVALTARLRQADYRPAEGAAVDLLVWRRASGAPGDIERVVHEQKGLLTDANGEVRVAFTPDGPGIYEAVATTAPGAANPASPRGGSVLKREGRDIFTVEDVDPELAVVVPRAPLLEQMANVTGGYFAALDDPPVPPPVKRPETLDVTQRTYHDLWTSPWLLLLAIGLFAGEWWMRRRWGYL